MAVAEAVVAAAVVDVAVIAAAATAAVVGAAAVDAAAAVAAAVVGAAAAAVVDAAVASVAVAVAAVYVVVYAVTSVAEILKEKIGDAPGYLLLSLVSQVLSWALLALSLRGSSFFSGWSSLAALLSGFFPALLNPH